MNRKLMCLVMAVAVCLFAGCAGIKTEEVTKSGATKKCEAYYFIGMGSSSEKNVSACGGEGSSTDSQTGQLGAAVIGAITKGLTVAE